MKQIRLLLFLGVGITAWAAEGIVGFSKPVPEPNDTGVQKKTSEPNVLELVVFDAVDVIELTPASEISRPPYHLLPLKTELVEGACLPLFLDVFRQDPNHTEAEPDFQLIDELLTTPAEEIDMEIMGALLDLHRDKLDLLRKASLCKTVEWPVLPSAPPRRREYYIYSLAVYPSPGETGRVKTDTESVVFTASEYLDFLDNIGRYGKLVALKARFHILRRDYENAAEWLRTGLRICRQMTMHSNSQMGVIAASNASEMLQQIELWIQMPNSPGLFRSLQDLPRPFLNAYSLAPLVEKRPERRLPSRFGLPMYAPSDEDNNTDEERVLPDYSNSLFRKTSDRIDRFIAILECLAGLRYYAVLYDGQLPYSLAGITEFRMPVDPVTNRQFVYRKVSNTYILETSDVDRGPSVSGFRYTIRMTPFSED